MYFFLAVFISVALFSAIQLLRLFFADADLCLLWNERFGRKKKELHGQVVWITGSSSGIGEYLAYELARYGCKLILSARREEELQRVKKQCLLSGNLKAEDVLVLPFDVSLTSTHTDVVNKAIDHFKQIDILVNNAGRSQRAMIVDTDLEVTRQMIDLNLIGPMSLTTAVLPHMLKRKAGHIVVTSSIAGKIGVPFSANYSATKFALHGWFEALRVEAYENHVAVTLICPGPVFSDLLRVAFTGQIGKETGMTMQPNEKRMSTARCADLIATAIANQMPEVWIASNPTLLFTYIMQYLPSLGRIIACKMGTKTIIKLREGQGYTGK